jgi:PAS domain S-box-containing protein
MCVIPVTPYRSFPASEVQISRCQRNVMGIDGMISDTASLHVLLNSLVDRSKHPNAVTKFRYTLVSEDSVVSGNQMMARWSMTTENAVQLGAKREVSKSGMLCAKFNSAHKIVHLELMFDVMAFMLQLKQSSGATTFNMVPNTVQTCIGQFSNQPMVITLAERPYTITHVNPAWEEMTSWTSEEVVGKHSCKILQGDETEEKTVEALICHVQFQRPSTAAFLNYDRYGRKFRHFMNVYPLSTDSKITHYFGLTVHYEKIDSCASDRLQFESTQSKSIESANNDSDN